MRLSSTRAHRPARRFTRAAVLAVLVTLAVPGVPGVPAVPAQAGPSSLVLADVVGDANSLNGQGLADEDLPGGVTTTPASAAGLDLVDVTVSSTFVTRKVRRGGSTRTVRECTGLRVTMELAGPPLGAAAYRVLGTSDANPSVWWLNYVVDPSDTRAEVRFNKTVDEPLNIQTVPVPVVVSGSTITWTVSSAVIAATGDKPVFEWSAIGAETRLSTGAVTAPRVDNIAQDQFFTVCG